MGRLVVCAGDGLVQSSTNLYGNRFLVFLFLMLRQVICYCQNQFSYPQPSSLNNDRALLRHGISIWIDVPIEMVAKNMIEEGVQIPVTELSTAESYSEVRGSLANIELACLINLLANKHPCF